MKGLYRLIEMNEEAEFCMTSDGVSVNCNIENTAFTNTVSVR